MSHQPRISEIGIVDVEFGEGVEIVKPLNLYGCRIGDHCFIGPFVEIQSGVVLGKRCRIQSHSFVCSLVQMGDDCFVSHGVVFINDLFQGGRPSNSSSAWKATRLGNRVAVGSNATILPVDICDDVVVGAGAVVTRDIKVPGIYAGNPAIRLRAF